MTLSSRTTTLLAVLLVISLGINFFVAGMAFSRHDRPHFRMMGGGPENMVAVRGTPGALSEEGREILWESLQGRGETIREHAQAMSQAQQAIRDALRAQPFDGEALAEAQEQMRSTVDAMQTAMQTRIAEVAARLSDEDRAALADMPVQSPMVSLRLQMRDRDHGPARPFFHRELPPGDSPPPAPGGER